MKSSDAYMEQTFSLKQKCQVTPPNPEGASLLYFKCFENVKVLPLGVSITTAVQESSVPVSYLSLTEIQKFSFLCLKSHREPPHSPVSILHKQHTGSSLLHSQVQPLTVF